MAASPAPTIRVAIVEDDPDVRALLCQWIREEPGFTCVFDAPNAETAHAALPGLKPDVVLHDIVLPGRSGIESVAGLKPLLPQTQFVMLTVYEDVEHIFAALSAGATGYMLKRTPRPALIAALREVHAGGSPMSSSIARKVVQSLHQARRPAAATEGLSARENQVLELLARGHLYKEIADEIGISVPTVNTYIRRIYEKLHVRSRAQAVAVYANFPGAPVRPPSAS
jgi:DNA-binding NarL/FixJ family response regulator